jgi:Uma2 family endonuclease
MNAPQKKQAPPKMTVDQFLDWWDEQPGDQRYELANGEVFAMSRESVEHARLKAAAWLALREGIRRAGLPCEAIIDGPGVAIPDYSYFVPDVIVVCGERLDGDASLVEAPVVVVEVLSPSTRVFDVEYKLSYYFAKPSLQHYLIVDGKSRVVVHHKRTGDAEALTQIVREGEITLDPPGLRVAFADFIPAGDAAAG